MTDIAQILLTGPLPIAGAVLLALILLFVTKATGRTLYYAARAVGVVRSFLPKLTIWNGIKAACIASLLYVFRFETSDYIQYFEQLHRPVYAVQYDSEEVTRKYQQRLSANVSPQEYGIIRDSISALSTELGLTPSAIYETALPECSLNPFVIRQDGGAAGIIQFTNAGLQGSGVSLDQVKQICKERNTPEMMRLTGWYLRNAAKNGKLTTGADVYTAVFCPSAINKSESAVLYSGYVNPAYYLNRGLDGWAMSGNKVVRDPAKIDGVIQKYELYLWLEFHKQELMQ